MAEDQAGESSVNAAGRDHHSAAGSRAAGGMARRRSTGRRWVTLQLPPTGHHRTGYQTGHRRTCYTTAKLLVCPATNCPMASCTAPPLYLHCRRVLHSNGKSSIVEERLYSFFFALFQNKTKLRFFWYLLFFTFNNEDVRFASILHNFRRFYFVLFRFL
jgi:hypothetical protein